MPREAITRIQALIIAVITVIAVVAGTIYYYLQYQGPPAPQAVKIGVLAPLSGPAAAQGKYLKQGFMLAAQDLNEKGGILGRKIELVFADDKTDPEIAARETERLIEVEKVDFLSGGTSTATHLATMDVVARYDIIILYSIPAGLSMDQKVLSNPEKYRNVFFLDLNSTVWGSFEILWLKEIVKAGQWAPRNNRVAIIAEDTDWGREVCETWKELMEEWGWEIVAYEIVDYGQTEFYSILTKIKPYDPVVIKAELTSVSSGVALVKQAKELDLKALIFPGYSAEVREFEELLGPYADYVVYYGYPVPKSWVDHLLKVFPDSDPTGAFWGYDSLLVLASAIEKAGSFETDKVREALLKYPHKGLWGTYVFHPETHRALWGPEYVTPAAVVFYKGIRYFVWPPRLKEGEWTYPYHEWVPPPW